jgi:hypothetical protein
MTDDEWYSKSQEDQDDILGMIALVWISSNEVGIFKMYPWKRSLGDRFEQILRPSTHDSECSFGMNDNVEAIAKIAACRAFADAGAEIDGDNVKLF